MTKLPMCDIFKLDQNKVKNIYAYGSRVYGTARPNSDYDYIIVGDFETDQIILLQHTATFYSISEFQKLIDEHEISALECLFLPSEHIVCEEVKFEFTLDLVKLRHSISAKASNSFVKAKKKIEVENEPLIGKKSLFHVFRMIDFGIQIAQTGKIDDYGACNGIFAQIMSFPDDWTLLKNTFQPLRNAEMTKFRLVANKL